MEKQSSADSKLKAILAKLDAPSERVKSADWGDPSEPVCIWGRLAGGKDEKVFVQIGDALLGIHSEDIVDIDEVDPSAPAGEAREVFIKLKASAEVTTTVKQEAKLVRAGEAMGGDIPFALGKPSVMVQVTEAELERQERKFEEWRRKVRLFGDFWASRGRSICTLGANNTQKWTTAGIGDVSMISDGTSNDGCEDL